jgi:hypothetical protein
LTAQAGYGHQHTAPWLNESALDRGLYIEVRHPRVIRNPKSFDVSILLNNLLGGDAVSVREVRYSLPGAFDKVAHARRQAIASKRASYRRYKAILEEMHHAGERNDRAAAARLQTESRRRLLDISSGAFRDRQRVDASLIPQVGKVMNLSVELDVVENGRPRTIRRDVAIPVEPLLPDGDGFWFAGDQHLHTAYSIDAFFLNGTTDNVAQYGAVAQTIGLDWAIVTDHTNLNFLVWYQPFLFTLGEGQAQNFRNHHDFLVLQGQEMGVGSPGALGEPAHLLAYPRAADSTGFLPNPCPGFITGHLNCEPEQVVIDRVNQHGGIGFIAHPFDSGFFFYAPWDQNSGAVGWAGLEIFSSDSGFLKPTDQSALLWWIELLDEIAPPQGGQLADRPEYPTRFPVGLGNSDAHHEGLIGNTFTYAHLPGVMHGSGIVPREDLMSAFVDGRVVASNGPLAYGEIQGAGTGEVAMVSPGENQITLTLETTPEFGPAGDYTLLVFVNGAPRQAVPPDNSTGFSRTVVVNETLSQPDKHVIVAAQRTQCDGCPHQDLRWVSIANPIWLELTNPVSASQPKRVQ